MDGSLEELVEDRGFLPRTSELLVKTRPDWMSIPMFISEDIAGKEFWLMLSIVVEVLEEKEDLFAIFPIGATMQDGSKRKRSDD